MTQAYGTQFRDYYGDTLFELDVTVDSDGYAECDEAWVIDEKGNRLADATELLNSAIHRHWIERRSFRNPDGKYQEYTLAEWLIDQNAHQLIEGRAGALIDKARDDLEEGLAAE